MRYTNSEVREIFKRIKYNVSTMSEHMPKAGSNWMNNLLVFRALESLNIVIGDFKKHIIDNYDLPRAVALNDIITPAWSEYWHRVEQKEFEVHEVAWEFRDLIDDLREWIKEEKQRREEALKRAIEKAFKEAEESKIEVEIKEEEEKEEEKQETKEIIDTEKLKSLFVDSFMIKDLIISGSSPVVEKKSRFDVLKQRMELVLEDNDKPVTQQDIGSIAYMIYQSPFTKPKFGEPKRKGERGRYAPLLKMLFDIIGKPHPNDTHQNKYKPNDEMINYFGDILKWQQK